ncbi:MAG: phytanoyl-CoA dioxygenase family protein [Chloroflexota bacterium]
MRVLTAEQMKRFDEDGYLVVEGVLDPERDIKPVLDEYNGVLDGIARDLVAEGKLRSTYAELPFVDRLVQVCEESGRNFPQHFDIALPQRGVKYDTPMHHGPAAFRVLTTPRLLDLVEDLMGPEIYSNPVQHIRTKLPPRAVSAGDRNGLIVAVPWHQDNGVVLPEADVATILTVWMPLTETTLDNGCMQVVPGSHRHGLDPHCPTAKGLSIPEQLIAEDHAIPLPMPVGSVLLLNQRTVHSSRENTTQNSVRISFDLRYQPVGQPTGRPTFPGFVARSKANPGAVLTDPSVWKQMWLDARERLARAEDPAYNRWSADAAVCA